MPIGDMIEKSLKYPWKNKALWFYGTLLAVFSAGSAVTNQYEPKEGDLNILGNLSNETIITIGVIGGIVIICFAIIAMIVSAWSKVALAKGAVLSDEGKAFSRKEIGKTGKRPVWKMIVLEALIPTLIFLAIVAVAAVIAIACYFLTQPLGLIIGIIIGVALLIAAIPLAIFWSLAWGLAARFVALGGSKAWESLSLARELLKGRFWSTFLFSILLSLIAGAASFVAILPLIFFGGIVVFCISVKAYAGVVVAGVLGILYLVFYVFVIGYFTAFRETALTLWWASLNKSKVETTSKKVVPAKTKKLPAEPKKTKKK